MLTDVLEELTASINRAVSSPETSVKVYQTARCNIPEGSHLQKIYNFYFFSGYLVSVLKYR
jgi:hypothetical protein